MLKVLKRNKHKTEVVKRGLNPISQAKIFNSTNYRFIEFPYLLFQNPQNIISELFIAHCYLSSIKQCKDIYVDIRSSLFSALIQPYEALYRHVDYVSANQLMAGVRPLPFGALKSDLRFCKRLV